jgi:hypothetical protein
MSDYTKLTAYDTKDGLTTGDPLKRVKGTELDDEFDAISTAIATKANLASPALTGTPTAPTASVGTNTTQLASTAFVQAALAASLYPVGSIYINATSAINPATLFGLHLVLVVSWLVLMQVMHCLTLLKKLVVVQMQLLLATLTLQQFQRHLTHILMMM